jgi:hypothetical protein
MQLKERVNRIREELKVKEKRMERHKQNKEKEHELEMERNNEYMKQYMAKLKDERE